jgi:hypothetical protein
LGADHGGPAVIAIFEDLKEISGVRVGEGRHQPVVQDDEIDPCQRRELILVSAVGS